MKPSKHTLLSIAFTLGAAASAQAAVLFADDFESDTANSSLGTSNWGTVTAGSGFVTVRDETTATPFGDPNQYLRMSADTGSSQIQVLSPYFTAASGAVTTLSFDFYEPSAGGNNDAMHFGYAFADLNAGGSRLRLQFNNGVISGVSGGTSTSYNMDAAYTIHLVFNDTASAINYTGGTVAANTAHVWFETLGSGSFVFAGNAAALNSSGEDSYAIGFRTFNTNRQEVWVDNVSLVEGAAAIPEPSVGLLGLGALLFAMRRRR